MKIIYKIGKESFSNLKDVISGTRTTSLNTFVEGGDMEALIHLPKIKSDPIRSEEVIKRAAAQTGRYTIIVFIEPIR